MLSPYWKARVEREHQEKLEKERTAATENASNIQVGLKVEASADTHRNNSDSISYPDNSHNPEESHAGVGKKIKPVFTPREKELSRSGVCIPNLTSPDDTTSNAKTTSEVENG